MTPDIIAIVVLTVVLTGTVRLLSTWKSKLIVLVLASAFAVLVGAL